MLMHIATLCSTVFCTNLLLANTLYEACAKAVYEKKEQILATQFETELKEWTVLPETLLQALADSQFIYQELEKRLESIRKEYPIICPDLYRNNAIAQDKLFISFTFQIPNPEPTQSAKNLGNAFVNLNGSELLVAYYMFYINPLAPFRHQENLANWLARHGKSAQRMFFYSKESMPLHYDFLLRDTKNYFSEIQLSDNSFYLYKTTAHILLDLMIDVEKERYNSEYVRNANKPTLTSTYNEILGDFFQKSKL